MAPWGCYSHNNCRTLSLVCCSTSLDHIRGQLPYTTSSRSSDALLACSAVNILGIGCKFLYQSTLSIPSHEAACSKDSLLRIRISNLILLKLPHELEILLCTGKEEVEVLQHQVKEEWLCPHEILKAYCM